MHTIALRCLILVLALSLGACGPSEWEEASESPLGASESGRVPERLLTVNPDMVERPPVTLAPNPDRNAYFGDLHVHTTYSFDAFAFGTTIGPRDAYRYAQGETIKHPAGFDMTLRQPLDFYAVTDHALFLGVAKEAADTSSEISKLEISEPLHNLNQPGNDGLLSVVPRLQVFGDFVPSALAMIVDGTLDPDMTAAISRTAWQDIIESAEQYNNPGQFTTFVAYEYTSSSNDRGNLHRNVIFRQAERLPAEPFSRFHSQNPEGLWDWMDGLRAQGIESLAIPHNSNGSNGQMFKLVDWAGNPMDDDYAEQRIRNEPIVELTQVKGTSETHPSLSDNDEWAEFEIMPYKVGAMEFSEPDGSYARQALRRGLGCEEAGITNPYKFGFVAASDTHTGAISDDESNFFSKIGILDSTPELRGSVPLPLWQSAIYGVLAPQLAMEVEGEAYSQTPVTTFGASGVAGVWAEENTREAIYDAFRRKETFATSGPRIRVRLFAGPGLDQLSFTDPNAIAAAYQMGVPMGGELQVEETSDPPSFLAWATGDPLSAPLQRLQVVKGWADGTETHEEIYDVACAGGASPDPNTHRCPDNQARVDLSDCSISADTGSGELKAVWHDPDFDPSQRAFYYVRALENPTCRWSTWDALRAGVPPRPDFPTSIQERAWSSPIWISPTTQAPGSQTAQVGSALSPDPPQGLDLL
ncbi:MAG: DUF3604 domain-containing protein [Myxococcota bacterium]|nr:DUF3604 domain-containing protein [Myxococcota bacterium]